MTPQPPDLTWRPCDHNRAENGTCVDCGALVLMRPGCPEREDHP